MSKTTLPDVLMIIVICSVLASGPFQAAVATVALAVLWTQR